MKRKLDLNALLLFYEVVEAGSINRAAARSGAPKSTISRKLSFLEDQVGAVLLKKSGRGLTLTDVGRELYDHCERIAAEVETAGLGAIRAQTELRGTLRVSMPVDFGTAWLSSAIAAFALRYPEIRLAIEANSRWIDVTEEPYDVAVQFGPVRDRQVVSRRLGRLTRGIYASPAFLQAHGVPRDVDDLARFDCIVTDHQRNEGVWTFRDPDGAPVAVAGRVTVNSVAVARELVVGGVGLGILPNIMCRNDLRANRLVRVLPEQNSPSLEVAATFLGRRKESRRLRAFVDFMAAELRLDAP